MGERLHCQTCPQEGKKPPRTITKTTFRTARMSLTALTPAERCTPRHQGTADGESAVMKRIPDTAPAIHNLCRSMGANRNVNGSGAWCCRRTLDPSREGWFLRGRYVLRNHLLSPTRRRTPAEPAADPQRESSLPVAAMDSTRPVHFLAARGTHPISACKQWSVEHGAEKSPPQPRTRRDSNVRALNHARRGPYCPPVRRRPGAHAPSEWLNPTSGRTAGNRHRVRLHSGCSGSPALGRTRHRRRPRHRA